MSKPTRLEYDSRLTKARGQPAPCERWRIECGASIGRSALPRQRWACLCRGPARRRQRHRARRQLSPPMVREPRWSRRPVPRRPDAPRSRRLRPRRRPSGNTVTGGGTDCNMFGYRDTMYSALRRPRIGSPITGSTALKVGCGLKDNGPLDQRRLLDAIDEDTLIQHMVCNAR